MDGSHRRNESTPDRKLGSVLALLAIGLAFTSGMSSLCATAQDRVIYQAGSDRQTASGLVVEFTGKDGVLLRAGGQERTIPAAQVIRIETARIASHEKALMALAEGKFESALALFVQARTEERRVWLRRELTADIVQCLRTLGDYKSAASQFQILTISDPKTPHFGSIPLHWMGSVSESTMSSASTGWRLDDEASESMQLITASALLTSTTNLRPQAIIVLEDLSTSDDPRIAFLARAQLWQIQYVRAAPALVRRWEEQVEYAPESLRPGPYFMLARALKQVDESEDAVLAWMRIPIFYPDHRDLSVAALYHAAEALDKLGRTEESAELYREIQQDYGESPLRQNVEMKESVTWEIE
jgi:tetratricopeptide (TPR) repeat protein